ncbi:L-threonylcarbamoyladenylate synthase [Paraglaciecola chathamensis]|jgi:tRNA threonylcarbamoyl adenosine modification protein (Sua5/YciO/YrdC/YwlC family)|uniref:Threonylcarbamoyl-AMP synthase n=3 Tax=Paraglaciecola chathamensis TaxID=368405 RepID=A0A8H9M385_9ALTE|nr:MULTISPECIES: L-threonylcarbamoyladenylate synthase [Paraglaciecola]MBN24017.1 threonylcarbamoyl-AMP synthase [Alteromonadaceae bacterium]MBJ2137320.1 threonylcarbamoyl-AMP synthase [Paraglaciecola chathamensis]MBU3016918.1 threonylcarbamoyl-AMP synthase [Paraglaciecola agarilytica]MDO6558103.1 L-threonylcarbamoyladenylate synthase [Paraglaciecola chathamensis]MDO6839728.1 L-threonylcarbamoyladenylate synthase [Paraglaciecola chathamensis]|tara:strand:+ start:11566 stop:12186 length:621 start_codon:yes stop_codon:yes gene_type:complete
MSQFFYIHPDNPQTRLIKQACELIHSGEVVVYPTDSGYSIGCHMDDKNALEQICRIRQIGKDHNFTLMCRDMSELSEYARVDNAAFRMIKNNTPGPYTFILKATKEVPKRLQNPKRRTIGIRVPDNAIALALLEELGEPMMSTTLILPNEIVAESDPDEIRDKLEKQVGLIIHGGFLGEQPTTVVDLSEGEPVIIRQGSGDASPFN